MERLNRKEIIENIVSTNKHNIFITYSFIIVAHAEYKAIIGGPLVRGCTLYVTSYPCNVCARLIIQSGISEIVHDKDKGDKNARKILRRRLTRLATNLNWVTLIIPIIGSVSLKKVSSTSYNRL